MGRESISKWIEYRSRSESEIDEIVDQENWKREVKAMMRDYPDNDFAPTVDLEDKRNRIRKVGGSINFKRLTKSEIEAIRLEKVEVYVESHDVEEEPENYLAPKSWHEINKRWMDGSRYFCGSTTSEFLVSNFPKNEEINLSKSNFSKGRIFDSIFSFSNFSNSKFDSVEFENVYFSNCNLAGVEFKDCIFKSCRLNGSNLELSNFENCSLIKGCIFDEARMQKAKFSGHRNLFDGVSIRRADLSEIDFYNFENVMFDENRVVGTIFPATYHKFRWPQLKSKYTPFSLLVNCVLLLAFVAPLLVKFVYYGVVSDFQQQAISVEMAALESLSNESRSIVEDWLSRNKIDTYKCRDEGSCRTVSVAEAVLFGGKYSPLYIAITIVGSILFFYRMKLTASVLSCIEKESISTILPSILDVSSLESDGKYVDAMSYIMYIFYIVSFSLISAKPIVVFT